MGLAQPVQYWKLIVETRTFSQSILSSVTSAMSLPMRHTGMGSRSPCDSFESAPPVVRGCAAKQKDRVKFPRGVGMVEIRPNRWRPRSVNVTLSLKRSFTGLLHSARSSVSLMLICLRFTGHPSGFSDKSEGTSGSIPRAGESSPAGGAALLLFRAKGLRGRVALFLTAVRGLALGGSFGLKRPAACPDRPLLASSEAGHGPFCLFPFLSTFLFRRCDRPPFEGVSTGSR